MIYIDLFNHLPELRPQLGTLSHCCPELAHRQQGHEVFMVEIEEHLKHILDIMSGTLPAQEFLQTTYNSLSPTFQKNPLI